MNRTPSPEAKALAEALFEAGKAVRHEDRVAAVFKAGDLYERATPEERTWAERYVHSCHVAQGLVSA